MRSFILTDFVDGKNNNKVWKIECIDANVIVHYGRVGSKLASNTKSFSSPYAAQRYMNEKIVEKTDKGYTEIELLDSNISSSRGAEAHLVAQEISTDPMVQKFVEKLISVNKHKILESTSLTINTDGLFQTPLGVVTPTSINAARNLLAEAMNTTDLPRITSQYLRYIPHDVGNKPDLSILSTPERIQKENDLLDGLMLSYEMAIKIPPTEKEVRKPTFNIDFKLINNTSEAMRIERYFETSKSKHHYGRGKAKIKNIFSLSLKEKNQVNDDNVIEVFHGTGEGNVLSIMKNGLMTSPPSAAIISGKMFGNGIYGAVQSTKSMGYTSGDNSMWMFICKFEMNKYYHPKTTMSYPPNGYDSIWAKAGDANLIHDELIVYKNDKVQITHLLEFTL